MKDELIAVTSFRHSSDCAVNDHTFPDLTATWGCCDCGVAFERLIAVAECANVLTRRLRDSGFGTTSDSALPGEFDTLEDALSSVFQKESEHGKDQ